MDSKNEVKEKLWQIIRTAAYDEELCNSDGDIICTMKRPIVNPDLAMLLVDKLLKNGVTLLPCKPGQVMYRLNTRHGVVVTFVVDGVLVHNDYMVICDEECNTFSDEDIGKKLFYTKEEAETVLAWRDK